MNLQALFHPAPINHPDEAEAEAFPFRNDVFHAYPERLVNAWNTLRAWNQKRSLQAPEILPDVVDECFSAVVTAELISGRTVSAWLLFPTKAGEISTPAAAVQLFSVVIKYVLSAGYCLHLVRSHFFLF